MSRAYLAPLALASLIATAACTTTPAPLTQLIEARRLASELHVEFAKAAEASNRAVMADTDEASATAADEAKRARETVDKDFNALRDALQALGYRDDLRALEAFKARFDEYRKLDDEILPLAVENTNLKAQHLSFGPGQEAADAFRAAVEVAARPAKGSCCGDASASQARAALLEIQVLQAPHIAESDDAAMTKIENRMQELARTARAAIDELKAADAAAALDRFLKINDEIVTLSRRNSNVRSLALSLGRKRMITAECEDDLRALEQALAGHAFSATR
jgi:uncharacterized protein YdcH (DUF465 family)